MPAVETSFVSADEYKLLPKHTSGTQLELIRGHLVSMPCTNWEQGEIAGNIGIVIKLFLKQHPMVRVALRSGILTERSPDTVRGPDVSFMSKDRMPLGERMNKFAEQTPDLCVEVLSESNTRRQLNEKIKEYFFTGARMVWVVDPDERSVTVFREPDRGTLLKEAATLEGGDVLPGFECKVADLFA